MNNNTCGCQHKATTSDPSTKKNEDKAKKKANEKRTYCTDEPTTNTNNK